MRNSYLLNSSSGMDTSRRTLYFRNRRYRWTILEKKKYILHNLNFLHKHIVYYAPRTRIYRIQWNQYVRIFLFLLLSYFIQNAYLNERASYSTCNHRHHLAFAYCPNHRKIELNIFCILFVAKYNIHTGDSMNDSLRIARGIWRPNRYIIANVFQTS